ncbi:MAG: DNA internalization-related competence protein ComEC/Rec2 [Clostridiales bacterium]|nr:DNA internalization-related competence protein ComEC/Rec2 [Clostridiales bacterium]
MDTTLSPSNQAETCRFSRSVCIERIIRSILARPCVYCLIMLLVGGYSAFYSSQVYAVFGAEVLLLTLATVISAETWKNREWMSFLLGLAAYFVAFSGFSSCRRAMESKMISEFYDGKAYVHSSNSIRDGYKNLQLILDTGEEVVYLTDEVFEYGQILTIRGELTPIHPSGNPGDLNYADHFKAKGIVRKLDPASVSHVSSSKNIFLAKGYKAGYVISQYCHRIWLRSSDEETAMFLSAMLVGDDSYIPDEVSSQFRKSNLSHLLVVSGAHVNYFASSFGAIFGLISKDKKKALILLGLGLFVFGFVTGWSGSATRSIFTYLLIRLFSGESRCVDRLSASAISGLLLEGIDPFSMFSFGLLLSFCATISILVFQERMFEKVSKVGKSIPTELKRSISCFLCAQLGMLPVLMFRQGHISPFSACISVFAGFPAEMICSFGLVVTLISVAFPIKILTDLLLVPIRGLVLMLWKMAQIGASSHLLDFRFQKYSVLVLVSVFGFVLVFLMRYGWKRRLILFVSACLLCFSVAAPLRHGRKLAEIYFLDVGQGDSAMIVTDSSVVLIDGGNIGCGDGILVGVLDYFGLEKLDMALASHLDTDHIGGIIELWRAGYVDHLVTPYWGESGEMAQLEASFANLPRSVEEFRSGSVIELGEACSLQILWPDQPVDGGNPDSMVILAELGQTRVLFTGDIDEEVEKMLISRLPNSLDILKVAHHGSRFSTSEAFLDEEKIDAAVISVGYNLYGHPSKEVLQRLEEHEVRIYRTDEAGCVKMTVYEDHWEIDYFFGDGKEKYGEAGKK